MTLTGATMDPGLLPRSPCRALPTIPAAAGFVMICLNLMDTQQTNSVLSFPKEPGNSCRGMMAVTKS